MLFISIPSNAKEYTYFVKVSSSDIFTEYLQTVYIIYRIIVYTYNLIYALDKHYIGTCTQMEKVIKDIIRKITTLEICVIQRIPYKRITLDVFHIFMIL